MTKRERVVAAIRGEDVDCVPSSFSLHFPADRAFGEAAIKSHFDFLTTIDTDILKIMNENLVPYMGEVERAADYKQIQVSIHDTFMVDQLDLIGKIVDRTDGNTFTMGTVHGITASAIHPLEKMSKRFDYNSVRSYLSQLVAEDPVPVVDGMKRIADALCDLVTESVKRGLDGIYYAALGGEKRFFTDEQFATWIEPLDKMVLRAIREAGGYCFLHICKDALNMDRYKAYPEFCDVANWGVYEAPFPLEAGRTMFAGKTIMGGLEHRSGVIVNGSPDEIRSEVHRIIRSVGKKRFILGADCTLDTYQNLHNVRIAVEAAREL